jgi:hypothetical protein
MGNRETGIVKWFNRLKAMALLSVTKGVMDKEDAAKCQTYSKNMLNLTIN